MEKAATKQQLHSSPQRKCTSANLTPLSSASSVKQQELSVQLEDLSYLQLAGLQYPGSKPQGINLPRLADMQGIQVSTTGAVCYTAFDRWHPSWDIVQTVG